MENILNSCPLVSVIIPAYNAEKVIRATMDSVFSQTYQNLQIIVVDDASTDSTPQILRSYEDPRLTVIRQDQNGHSCAARNRALSCATGDYVAFLDNDDIWHPEKIEKQVAFLEQHPHYGACFTWGNIIDENGNIRTPDDPDTRWLHNAFHEGNRSRTEWLMRLLTQGNCFLQSSAFVRGEILRKIGHQNLSLVQLQDFELWLRILSQANIYVLCQELTSFRRNVGGGSVSAVTERSRNQSVNEDIFVCTHYFDYIPDEQFIALFRDHFRNPLSATHEELACEKAFLLEKAYCAPEPGLAMLQKLLSCPETAAILAEKFGYTQKDFYEANSRRRYLDLGMQYQLEDERHRMEQELLNRDGHISQLMQTERDLTNRLLTQEQTNLHLSQNLTQRTGEYQQTKAALANAENRITALQAEKQNLQNQKQDLQNQYQQLEFALACREGECQQLRDKENMLKNEVAALRISRSYRLGQKFAAVARFFVPSGSKRALFARLLLTFLKHPIKFLQNLTPRKIKKFLRNLRKGNVEAINGMIYSNITGGPVPSALEVVNPQIVEISQVEKTIDDYPVLTIPQWEDPQVSIVIPVYNQFEFTYHCVESILKNSGDITYEILIANDCSSDLTTEIDKILPGVRCITNEQNLRFLRNCNNAAKYAKGKYILFLNNDTQVQENWLEPLVTLIESAEDIGMVGSKLIYPDGRLQEAGGILWRDGSAWNFGNRQNPALPQFNYVKQVDYISGAAIMLSRALWEEIGGFDEHFAPAYCEDSDLAFTIRKMGYRVMYQPLSVVVHFEGVSNGTDTSSGQKRYQVENSIKFKEKWAEELAKHPENAENVFQARDYSFGKPTLLMVDHYVPHYDKDAGSRTVFQYLKLFVKAGFNVKFIGDNFYQHEPYTTTLQQMGIEVLYGPDAAAGWKTWIKENAEHFDYVFLNRPHIAPKYLDFIRENTKARIIYYGHDLAFVREMREYEITGDASFKDSSIEWQGKELALMAQADMAYYPSYVEVDAIHAIDPSIKVKAIPAYLFENVTWEGYDFDSRKDIMFIGGFSHRPNVDAVKWLAKEIMPELLKLLPDIKVHILGSNAPKEVLDLASKHLIIEGFVTDEQLEQFYRTSRLSVVPLRYGAGIKGKVIEAMRFGTPVVTTSTGSEGIPNAEAAMIIEDDPKEIARKIAAVYNDPDRLVDMSKNCIGYIQENYSPSNAIQVIGPDFDIC